ncbi:MAG: hypothetical protein ACLFSO_02915 [Halanaerobium sp.]
MKNFLKKASAYLLVMFLIAAAVFSLNYVLGRRLARDLENDIEEIAAENDYQLRYLNLSTNPLLKRVEINTLSLLKNNEESYEINGAVLEFSWQQILNYIKEREFLDTKEMKAEIDKFSFYDLQQNNHFDFFNTSLNYQGEINSESLKDPLKLIQNDHQLTVLTDELNYDYPFYRSYGINKNNWEQISTFKGFGFNVNYQSRDSQLSINDFILKNEFIDYEIDLETTIEEIMEDKNDLDKEDSETAENDEQKEVESGLEEIILFSNQEGKILLKELKSNYQLVLDGQLLDISENNLVNQLAFNELSLASELEIYLDAESSSYQFQQFDLDFDLQEFELELAETLSQGVNESTFGILAQDNQFELIVDSLNYQQQFSHPQGKSDLNLTSNLIDARLNAEFNYNQQIPYISSSSLKLKPKNSSVEQLILFAQMLYDEQLSQDEEGFYHLESWGDLDNLNFEKN